MRLVCPNCGAQYNVADDAIPPGGRDVQCSSCHQTWFQTDHATATAEAQTARPEKSRVLSRPLMKEEFINPASDSIAAAISNVIAKDVEDAAKEVVAEELAEAPPAEMPRKVLDSAVADILRQEAARADSVPKPKLTDADIAPPVTQAETRHEFVDADETRKRIAQMTEDEGGVRTGQKPVFEDPSNTIPDIHEINATLRARAAASDTSGLTEAEKAAARERSGFRGGFFFVLIVLAVLIGPYFFADQITENLPQTVGFMADYTNTIDQIRVQLNQMFGSVFQ